MKPQASPALTPSSRWVLALAMAVALCGHGRISLGASETAGSLEISSPEVRVQVSAQGPGFSDTRATSGNPRSTWTFEMRITTWGRRGAMTVVHPTRPKTRNNVVETEHLGLTEWIEGGHLIRQGITIESTPARSAVNSGPLLFELELGGSLHLRPGRVGRSLRFLNPAGGPTPLELRELQLWDAYGAWVPSWFAREGDSLRLVVDDSSAALPISGQWVWIPASLASESAASKALTDIVVDDPNNTIDIGNGFCSLAEAITNANSGGQLSANAGECEAGTGGSDTIVVISDIALGQVLDFSNGRTANPKITSPVTILVAGPPLNCTAINARHFLVGAGGHMTLKDATLTGGTAGSLVVESSGIATLENVTINQSNSAGTGGAIEIQATTGTLTITDSVIASCAATQGGGAIATSGDTTIERCELKGNSADGPGTPIGGAILQSGGTLVVKNTMITGNLAKLGGALATVDAGSTATFTNVTIAGNFAGSIPPGSGNFGAIRRLTSDTVILRNSLVWGNGSEVGDLISGGANTIIETTGIEGACPSGATCSNEVLLLPGDTIFITPDPAPPAKPGGNYHLDLTASMVIDQGNNTFATDAGLVIDFEGNARFRAGTVDLGADEADDCSQLIFPADVSTAMALREAIDCANIMNPPGPTSTPLSIVISASIELGETYFSVDGNNGLPSVDSKIILHGDPDVLPTLSRAVAAGDSFRLLHVASLGELNISDLILENGSAQDSDPSREEDDDGGAIFGRGLFTLDNCTVTGNQAADLGGAIFNEAVAPVPTIRDSIISANLAGNSGGAISNSGTLSVQSCVVSGNQATSGGGGLNVDAGGIELFNSIVSGNSAADGGGVQIAASPARADLIYSTVAGNAGSTGIRNLGDLVVLNSIVWGNQGTLQINSTGAATSLTTFSGIEGQDFNDPSNIDLVGQDPFVQSSPWSSAPTILGDYHLLPSLFNPVLDQGNEAAVNPLLMLDSDIDLENRLLGYEVDMGADEINCSFVSRPATAAELRWAMVCVSADSSAGTLTLAADIVLPDARAIDVLDGNNGTPSVSGELVIVGDGHTISRSSLAIDSFRLFHVSVGGKLTLRDLRLENGLAQGLDAIPNLNRDDDGGAIYNLGTLTVDSAWFSSNQAEKGGAIFSEGTMALVRVNVFGNQASDSGGGIMNTGPAVIDRSQLSANEAADMGGGMMNTGLLAALEMRSSMISGNLASFGGGFAQNVGTSTMTHVTVAHNCATATTGLCDVTTVPPVNPTPPPDYASSVGGGLAVEDGTVTLNNSLIMGNTAFADGQITLFSFATLNLNATGLEGVPPSGSVFVDPDFLILDSNDKIFRNPTAATNSPTDAGDYHLDPAAANRAVDAGNVLLTLAGNVDFDIDDEARIKVGGVDMGADEAVPAGNDGWARTGFMTAKREGHTANLLPDGRLIVIGGEGDATSEVPTPLVAEVEIWDPTTGIWTEVEPLPPSAIDPPDTPVPLRGRGRHSATTLPNGWILVIGGVYGTAWTTTDEILLYNPKTNNWRIDSSSLATARSNHTASLMADGRVLVVSGCTGFSGNGPNPPDPLTADDAYNYCDDTVLGTAEIWQGMYDPGTDVWTTTVSPAGTMTSARHFHCATLLPDGKVLITGGCSLPSDMSGPNPQVCEGEQQSAEIFDPAGGGSWTAIATSMLSPRHAHTATLLPDGDVLVAGGDQFGTVERLELPSTWTSQGSMPTGPLYHHSATLLPEGNLLYIGGCQNDQVPCDCLQSCSSSAMTYDPDQTTAVPWDDAFVGDPIGSRPRASSTLLPGGSVLVTGYLQTGGAPTEIFLADDTQPETTSNSMNIARSQHGAVLLTSGNVLAFGGQSGSSQLTSTEVFNPGVEPPTWTTLTSSMGNTRLDPNAVLLQGGAVFVVGGSETTKAPEIFTPGSATTGIWSAVSWPGCEPPIPGPSSCPPASTATLLPSGRVLVLDGAEGHVYDPLLENWSASLGQLINNRGTGFEAVLLPTGQVLVLGGGGNCPVCTELFDPYSTGSPVNSQPTGVLNDARTTGFTATLLPSGQVLVAGGWVSDTTALDSAELYDPATGAWTLTTPMTVPRRYHSAIVLPSGKVLVSGGQFSTDQATLESQEIFDPATATWAEVSSGERRAGHSATLVPDGRILLAGGSALAGRIELATAQTLSELYTPHPAPPSRQPSLTPLVSFTHSSDVTVSGTGLGGDSEASGGSRHGSGVNRPLFSMLNIHTGSLAWLQPNVLPVFCPQVSPPLGFCAGQPADVVFKNLPSTLDPGNYLLTAWASGVQGRSVPASMDCSLEFTSQPTDTTVTIGDTGTFSVVANGGRFHQWFKCVSGRCTEITGATSSTYVTDVIAGVDTGTSYYCEVDSGCTVIDSSTATLTVADSTAPTVAVVAPSGGEYWLLSDIGQPANSEVVTWSMSDDVRICQVEAGLICSTDAGATWEAATTTTVGGLPATFGSGGTCAFPGEATSSAIYTMQLTAPCATGALYKAQVTVTDHAGNAATATSASAFYMVQPNPDSVSTLILHNLDRMQSVMGLTVTQTASLSTKLHELADHPLVEGWVVDLGGVPAINAWYTLWDSSLLAPDEGNDVLFGTDGIHDYLVNDLISAFPNVENIVIVGDDRIIPFARITDGAALLLESEYTASGTDLTATGTSVGKAIAAGYYLSDDPLVVLDDVAVAELDTTIFTADLAVGRLVEQPDEIIGTIATFISQGGGLDLTSRDPATHHWALVTGYDFLIDSANTVTEEWKNLLGVSITDTASFAPIDASLVSSDFGLPGSSGFDADDRAAALLQHLQGGHDDPPGGSYGVMNLNGHATHYETGVPGTGTFDIQGLDTSLITGADLAGTVAYGVGCHAGLVVAGSVDANDHPQDLPQTMLAAGTVAYVANTGYGWGLVSGIGYGERLVQLLTEELTAGGSVAFGEAVRQAKLRYVLEAPSFDQYDVKSLHQWTLYGLPMYTVRVSNGARAVRPFGGAAQDPGNLPARQQLGEVVVNQRVSSGSDGDRALPSYLTKLSLSFDLSAPGVYTKRTATGLTTTESGCSDPDGCYYLLNGLVQRASGSSDLPLQPYLIFDSRLSGTSQHGVLWMGGTYDEETDWVPVIADLVSNAGTDGDHGAAPKHSLGSPSSLGNLDGPSPDDCRLVDYETSSLVVLAGEAVDKSGLQLWDVERVFNSIDLESLYYNNTSDSTFNCDRIGPEFGVEPLPDGYHELIDTILSFQVPVSDLDADIWRVVVIYNDEAQDSWVPLELEEDSGNPGNWIGSLDLLGTAVTTYLIQAVDTRGNVGVVPYIPTELPTSGVDIDLPDTVDLPFIFGDGLENGNSALWNGVVR